MDEPRLLKKHVPSHKLVNHETQSLSCMWSHSRSDFGFLWLLGNLYNTFFTKHLRAASSVKSEMQVKIMTSM